MVLSHFGFLFGKSQKNPRRSFQKRGQRDSHEIGGYELVLQVRMACVAGLFHLAPLRFSFTLIRLGLARSLWENDHGEEEKELFNLTNTSGTTIYILMLICHFSREERLTCFFESTFFIFFLTSEIIRCSVKLIWITYVNSKFFPRIFW